MNTSENIISKNNKICMRGMRIEDQAEDFCTYIYDILYAIRKVHDKYLGDDAVVLSRKIVFEIEMDLLDLNIHVGRYDRQLRDYLEHNDYYAYQNFTT